MAFISTMACDFYPIMQAFKLMKPPFESCTVSTNLARSVWIIAESPHADWVLCMWHIACGTLLTSCNDLLSFPGGMAKLTAWAGHIAMSDSGMFV